MIRINLLGAERQAALQPVVVAGSGDNRRMVMTAALVLTLCAALVGWRYWVIGEDSKRLDRDIAAAQQETVRLQSVLVQVQQFEQRKAQLQQRVTLIEQLRSDQIGPVHMLDQISRALPPTVWLTELKQTAVPGEVVIAGRCTALTALSDFVGNLEASGYFKKSVEIVSSTTEVLTKPPGELVKFEIKGLFQLPAGLRPAGPAGAAPSAPPVKSED